MDFNVRIIEMRRIITSNLSDATVCYGQKFIFITVSESLGKLAECLQNWGLLHQSVIKQISKLQHLQVLLSIDPRKPRYQYQVLWGNFGQNLGISGIVAALVIQLKRIHENDAVRNKENVYIMS